MPTQLCQVSKSPKTRALYYFVSEVLNFLIRYYCLCFHIGNQVLEPMALLSLLSFLVPGHLARVSARYQYYFVSEVLNFLIR